MTVETRSQLDLDTLQSDVMQFLNDYEFLYVAGDPSKINRCRLCVFQLFHVPMHIHWFGSIRLGSQATVERSIGEAEHKIHSKKDLFKNLANIITEQEVIRILQEYYPHLRIGAYARTASAQQPAVLRLVQEFPSKLIEAGHITVIKKSVYQDWRQGSLSIRLFGKLKLANGYTLRSRVSEGFSSSLSSRKYRWFEGNDASKAEPFFGEALAFYEVEHQTATKHFAVYRPLESVNQPYPTVVRGKWPSRETLCIVEIKSIQSIVGIWEAPNSGFVYILRRHPALLLLNPEERGLGASLEDERMGDGDENN
ncbi:hypothetical protein BKA70DRAFT_1493495 [Coprinopsis sp. MPI-PUGE-AT-0042]|nr:hypothetical protein BKA70DRAFT_1493495 [Coprinopsis sp. MPI-PUGE-AT-0042]